MSQETSGGDIRLECLAIILRKCIGTDEKKIKELVVSLSEDGILKSRDERRFLTELIEKGETDDAIQLMISKVASSEQGVKYFLKVLNYEDLVEDKRYPEILFQVLEEAHSNEARTILVSLWDELESFQQDVEAVVSQIWPEHKQLSTESWPLGLIHFCLKSSGEDLQKVQDFVSSVSFLQPQRADSTQSDDECEPGKTYFTETSLGSDLGGSESLESFVVISKDGENATEKPTESSVDSQEAINKRMQDAIANNDGSPGTSLSDSYPPPAYVSEESSMVAPASFPPRSTEMSPTPEKDSTGAEEQELGQLKSTNTSHNVQGTSEATSEADVPTCGSEEQSLTQSLSAERSFDYEINATAPGVNSMFDKDVQNVPGSQDGESQNMESSTRNEIPSLPIPPKEEKSADTDSQTPGLNTGDAVRRNEPASSPNSNQTDMENIPDVQNVPGSQDGESQNMESPTRSEIPSLPILPKEKKSADVQNVPGSQDGESQNMESSTRSEIPSLPILPKEKKSADTDSQMPGLNTGDAARRNKPASSPKSNQTDMENIPDVQNVPGSQDGESQNMESSTRSEIPSLSILPKEEKFADTDPQTPGLNTGDAVRRNEPASSSNSNQTDMENIPDVQNVPGSQDGESQNMESSTTSEIPSLSILPKEKKSADTDSQMPGLNTGDAVRRNKPVSSPNSNQTDIKNIPDVQNVPRTQDGESQNMESSTRSEIPSLPIPPKEKKFADTDSQTPVLYTGDAVRRNDPPSSPNSNQTDMENIPDIQNVTDRQDGGSFNTRSSARSKIPIPPGEPKDQNSAGTESQTSALNNDDAQGENEVASASKSNLPGATRTCGPLSSTWVKIQQERNVGNSAGEDQDLDPNGDESTLPPSYQTGKDEEMNPGAVGPRVPSTRLRRRQAGESNAQEMAENMLLPISDGTESIENSFENIETVPINRTSGVHSPVTRQPTSFTSDRLIADRLQVDEVLQHSREQTVSSSGGGPDASIAQRFWNSWSKKTVSVHFRVFIQNIPREYRHGFSPAMKINGEFIGMRKYRMGYFYADFKTTCSTLKYCYTLTSSEWYFKEVLPKPYTARIIKLDGDIVTYDVACFEDIGEKRWVEMVKQTMKKHLPSSDIIFSGNFQFSESDVFHWIRDALEGWVLDGPDLRSYKLKKKDVEQTLKDWLASIEETSERSSEQIEKHALCSLGVAVALFKLNLKIQNPKLFIRICKGLDTQHLSYSQQITLFREVHRHFLTGGRDDSVQRRICSALEFLLKNSQEYQNLICLLIVPLYTTVRYNGKEIVRLNMPFPNLLSTRAMLPDIGEGEWESFRKGVLQDKLEKQKLLGLADVVLRISEAHPWFVDTYQYLISADILMELIRSKRELSEKFQLDSVFKQILPLLEPLTFPKPKTLQANRTKVAELSTYLDSQFTRLSHSGTVQSRTSDVKVYIARSASLIGKMLAETLGRIVDAKSFTKSERNSISWLISMATRTVSLFYSMNAEESCREDSLSFVSKIFELVEMTISENAYSENSLTTREVEFYNNLFTKSWCKPQFQEKWIKMLEGQVQFILDEKWSQPEEGIDFLRFYLDTLKEVKFEVEVNFLFTEKAVASAKDALLSHDFASGLDLLKALGGGRQLGTVFANSFEKEFRKFQKNVSTNFRLQALGFLMQSPMVLRFYRLFGPQSMSELSSKSKDIKQVNEMAIRLQEDFSKGQLTLEEFHLTSKNQGQATELMILARSPVTFTEQTLIPEPGKRDLEIELLFTTYSSQVSKYEAETGAINFFVNFSKTLRERKIHVDCSSLERICGKRSSDVKLGDLKHERLQKNEMDSIFLLYKLEGSRFLYDTAKEVARMHYRNSQPGAHMGNSLDMDFRSALSKIWEGTKTSLLKFIQDVDAGTLSPDSITKYFGFTDGNAEELRKELIKLYKFADASLVTRKGEKQLEKEVSTKARQLAHVFKIQRNLETLKWFDDFRKKSNLKGKFEPLEKFQTSYQTLGEMELQKLSGLLDIDEKRLKILHAFTEQEALIDWIKTSMKAESNVRGLCLVAMESTRYNPMQADKWSCLADAVAGFESLLFNLDEISNMKDLLRRCDTVWNKVDRDKSFVKKWSDVGKDVAWYKKHEKLYGSEEMFALNFAQEVNNQGQYIISNFEKSSEKVSLRNSIKLHFSHTDRDACPAEYESTAFDTSLREFQEGVGIDYLHGIQSTLTLISSDSDDGKTEIKQFIAVLNAVESLATAYADLVNAGFMLLNDWEAVASCKKSRDHDFMTEHIMTLRITFKSDLAALVRTVSIQDLNLMAGILRDALKRWKYHIARMRLSHYYLNDYSIQQIKYLCSQLGKVRQGSFEEQAYLLLSDWPKGMMTPIIHESLNEAIAAPDKEDSGNDEEPSADAADVSEEVALIRKKRRAVRYLVNDESTSDAIAKAAVQAEGHEDLTNCANWILLHEFENDLVKKLCGEFDQNAGFVCDQNDIQEDFTILQNRSAKTLGGMITLLQEKASEKGSDLLEAVKTIFTGYLRNTTTLTLEDCLSVHHLGRFLTILHSKMEAKVPVAERQLPKTFKKGKPNFILAQSQSMISFALSLYAEEKSMKKLPTPAEILLCSDTTSEDEVERFMHRAICKHPSEAKQIFCLLFAEKLNLNVSKVLENIFEKLSQDERCSKDYQLVIFSSDHQHFVSVRFDEHRTEKPDFDEKQIQSFVTEYMTEKTAVGMERVKVVSSVRSGVGKSLHVKRLCELVPGSSQSTTIRLLEKDICMKRVMKSLLSGQDSAERPQLIHIDLTPAVQNGTEKFMFDLLILGLIKDSSGKVWRRNENHSYVIEATNSPESQPVQTLDLLPTTQCQAPKAVLEQLQTSERLKDALLMDEGEYNSDTFQRPLQYLLRHKEGVSLSQYTYEATEQNAQNTRAQCLALLLEYCGIEDPSWAQLKHFVSFLDIQLKNCEKSVFCQIGELKGLKEFAVKFMISMAQDFATPSLVISDESSRCEGNMHRNVLENYQMRRKWEEQDHPFVFFNDDGETMTFVNVDIDKAGNLLDKDGKIAAKAIISKRLLKLLHRQGIDLGHKFHTLGREEMLLRLCRIMGIALPPDPSPAKTKNYRPKPYDPDPTYELTRDNVLKMIAIYMRFRCNIPVIIMGETGCGKTRMVEFMSKLQAGPAATNAIMNTVKIHGGIGVEDIFKSVKEIVSRQEKRKILFYDEANTTTAIYAIKEVMCDSTIDGKPLENVKVEKANETCQIQIVAACNPYKQLSEKAREKMEASGLGYRVATTKTTERLGTIAMRTLVYRVVALPPSIQPFVWDFGDLTEETEKIYIRKMVASKLERKFSLGQEDSEMVVNILSCVQAYIKEQKEECRYVSLRDVERTVKLYKWFAKHKEVLFRDMDKLLSKRETDGRTHPSIPNSLRCLLHAVGISYHVSLEDRRGFRDKISEALKDREIEISQYDIAEEYRACQTVFHRNLKSDDNVAWNEALRENVFLMAVCADVKLPLYLIGKPGSSKSLAKTIVEANMKGPSSSSPFFQKLKKVEVLSFQCSALTKASGIKRIFKDAAERQKHGDLKKFTSMVVLDEIGLAEDSVHMPLKILHPLLESGSVDSGGLTEFKESEKVAFTGISNWALDPAKMNRGIFVTRGPPSERDLFDTARGLFQGNSGKLNEYHTLLENLTKAYLDVYQNQGDQFFGLRDYYSLIKMIRVMSEKQQSAAEINKKDIAYVLSRNFSGGKETHQRALVQSISNHLDLKPEDMSVASLEKLVTDNILSEDDRFLLLLTVQHSSVNLLQRIMPDFQKAQVIFGSSFPGDHTYAVLCKSINRIKVCMEKGIKAILLNMTDIHESLYDVLNQHFVTFGDQRYVAIGLGSHRVWTRIHKSFRLIVIEKREIVHSEYPIPLINRLEKHHLVSKSLLSPKQQNAERHLTTWSKKFANTYTFDVSSAFIGYHQDTPSSVVLAYSGEGKETHKEVLLQIATPDSLYRLSNSKLNKEQEKLMGIYMEEQTHDSLFGLLNSAKANRQKRLEIFEVISFSNILTEDVRRDIEQKLNLIPNSVMLLFLQQFKVEEEYTRKLDDFFSRCSEEQNLQKVDSKELENVAILLIQTAKAQEYGKLIECAKHNFMNKLVEVETERMKSEKIIIAFISSTARSVQSNGNASQFSIQHARGWNLVYVDELRHLQSNSSTTLISSFYKKSIPDIIKEGVTLLEKSNSIRSHVLLLLKDCISLAMAKVSNTGNSGERKLQRIQILQRIWSDKKGVTEEIRHSFWKILLQKMMILYEKASEQHSDRKEWIVREARSPEKLQEGGTFGKTIHLHLKHQLADILAFVVSIIDENNNLALLLSEDVGMEWKWELWLQLFNVIPLGKLSTDQRDYSVKTVHHLEMDSSCKFPFSFMIFNEFEVLFEHSKAFALESEERRFQQEIYFYKRVKEECSVGISKVFQLWNTANCVKMMMEFAHDLLKFCFKNGANNEDELDVVLKILFEYSKKKWNEKNREVNGVAVTFYTYQAISDHLLTISSVLKICPDLKNFAKNWITKQEENSEFVIHEYAVVELISWTHQKASKIEDEKSCSEWMNVSAQMKKTYHSLRDAITSAERKEELQKKSQPVILLDTLLTHLLPWDKRDSDYDKYAALIVTQAKKVFRAMERMGIHSKDVLKIVTTTTRKTCEDLELSLSMNWQKPICICGKKIQTPVKMPCGCFICETCSDMKQRESRTCMRCCKPLPEGSKGAPPVLNSTQRKRLDNFQASCTSFFLEYLHEHCFSDNAPLDGNSEEREKLQAIFEGTLVPEVPSGLRNRKGFIIETAKLNLNIATKSSIFLLLLQRNPEFLTDKLNENLTKGSMDSTLLHSVLKGLENWYANNATEQDVQEYQEKLLRQAWDSLHENQGKLVTLEILKYVAQIRYALTSLVTIVEERRAASKTAEAMPNLVLRGRDLCEQSNASIIRKFITDVGAARYGSQWPTEILRSEKFKALIDKERGEGREDCADYWKILRDRYTLEKPKIPIFSQKTEFLSLENLPEFLGRIRTGSTSFLNPRGTEGEILLQSNYLSKHFTDAVCFPTRVGRGLYQLVLLTAGIVLCKLPMMKELHNLILDPEHTMTWFWPGMPESIHDETSKAMTEEVPYACPNGHVYYIGECTYPDSMARCPEPDCNALIGGILHIAAEGNQRLEREQQAQCGYQLHLKKMGVDNPADRVTEQAASVIQFFIHSCMLVALKRRKDEILRMIRKNAKEGYIFLLERLNANLTGLARGLGCNIDEAFIILASILGRMSEEDFEAKNDDPQQGWTDKDSRRKWEEKFRERYLLPIFQQVDDVILAGKKRIRQGVDQTGAPEEEIDQSKQRLTWTNPLLWKYMREPTASHLLHEIADSDLSGGVLRTILRCPNLHLLKHLRRTLQLQATLIQRYQNKLDMEEAENYTFHQIQRNGNYDVIRLIEEYINLWNQMLPILEVKYSTDNVVTQYMKKIDINTPITMAMPSARGRGRCAKILAEYLIDLQNEFLTNCMDADKSIDRIAETEVTKLLPTHIVCVNKWKDLLPMVHLHCGYSITTDGYGERHHRISYNIAALEKEAKEKHVVYKRRIKKESLPCIKYSQDVGVGTDWVEVEKNVKQVPLPSGIVQEIDDKVLLATLAEVCEGVRTLTQAITFLAKVKVKSEDADKKLHEYLELDLMLSANHLGMVPKGAKICHTLALYQKLSCHKAVCFVRQGLDPYKECLQGKQEKITDEGVLAKLKDAFEFIDRSSLRQYLNELLIKAPDYQPWWSLCYILPNVTFIDESADVSWYARIPREVQFKHVPDLFRLSIEGIGPVQEA